jgi:hypothetical protein
MDKKPLIGVSICAVVILVLASLSNVVGYQSVKSTVVNDSPLFQTRTQRATNQQQNILTSQYLGMGKGNILYFPIRDNKTELLKKAILIISKMNEKTFARFIELCIQKTRKDINLKDVNSNEIIQLLHSLRNNPKIINNYLINRDNHNITLSNLNTICHWHPGCMINGLYFFLVIFVALSITYIALLIEVLLSLIFPTVVWWCHSVMICK